MNDPPQYSIMILDPKHRQLMCAPKIEALDYILGF